MNKKEFINRLRDKADYSEDECILITDIIENNFLIGKKNKEKTINELMEKLELSEIKSEEIYNISMHIISLELKEKIKHPFKSQ